MIKDESVIEISSVWEDESLFEVRITASNGKFTGEARCYTIRDEIQKLASAIKGFPKSLSDQVEFSTYSSNDFSYFTMKFACTDGLGHISVRIKVADIITYSNAPQVNNYSEFDIAVEPAAIDSFSTALSELSKARLGEVTAVMKSYPTSRSSR